MLKGFRDQNRLSLFSIAGDPPGGCTGSLGGAENGARYAEMSTLVGGFFESICEQDWTRFADDLVFMMTGYRQQIFLSASPDPATITASFQGIPIAIDYRADTNSVHIDRALVDDGEVAIRYRTRCE